MSGFKIPTPVPAISGSSYTMANSAYEHIAKEIEKFQNTLDSEHEVGLMLASFGQTVMMAVEDIDYQNPNLLYFYGTIDGSPAQLIQHLNQLNFVLTAVSRQPELPARRIGFQFLQESVKAD